MHCNTLSLWAIGLSASNGCGQAFACALSLRLRLALTLTLTLTLTASFAAPSFAAELVHHTVTVDNHPFAVWEKTPPKPHHAVVLVHGRTWSSRPDFDLTTDAVDLSLMNGLVDAGIATYAVDMRGYGATPRDPSGWLTPQRAAADLLGVLRWVNLAIRSNANPNARAHLFGWSYGSMIAQLAVQQLADQQQTVVAGLTLFGYPIRRGITKEPENAQGPAPAAANTRRNAASDFITPNSIDQVAIDAFVEHALRADPIRADWRELHQWRALDGRKVQVPTLLLQGEFDPLAKRRAHRRLMRRLDTEDKQWVVIKQGDHAAFMEPNLGARTQFLNLLTEFIRSH